VATEDRPYRFALEFAVTRTTGFNRYQTQQATDLDIEDWRDEIDRLDEQLVKLLNARSQCAIELGRIKRELGLAIYSPDREREVIAHVTGINPGPLDRTAVRRLFERIIDESRRIERVTVERESKDGDAVKRKKRQKQRAG